VRRLLITAILLCACSAAAPVPASAATGVGLPIIPWHSNTLRPPGFSSNAEQAFAAAKTSPALQALHKRDHPLLLQAQLWLGKRHYWVIDFSFRGRIVASADVSPSGRLMNAWTGPLAIAPYARGNYAPLFDSVWVLLPFSLAFLLVFINPRRWPGLMLLDGLVVLSFLVSFELFEHRHIEAAVWAVYPPLLYLLARMAWLGVRGARHRSLFSGWMSGRVLAGGLLALVAARVALCLSNYLVIDVGYASVIGAHRILHGQALYYATAAHGDTYGPIAYLAYLPFELVFPWHGKWDYMPAAHVASVVFDLFTVLGLYLLGRRLRADGAGKRLGLMLAWLWAACPFTLLGLIMHSNDGLIAMLSVFALLVFANPAARGAMLGLAAAAKFSPAALLPLFARPGGRGVASSIRAAGAFTLVVLLAVLLFLPSGGLSEFYNHTIGFQLNRADVFSAWALHPTLTPLKVILEIAAALFALWLIAFPRELTLSQVSALACAVTIAVQLPSVHWFYYYLVWIVPFFAVAVLGVGARPRASLDEIERFDAPPERGERPEVALV
jgi:hypothetical protein